MHYINILWDNFSQIDFVLYIVMPSSIVLIILTYILFNIRLIRLSFDRDIFSHNNSSSKLEEEFEKVINE